MVGLVPRHVVQSQHLFWSLTPLPCRRVHAPAAAPAFPAGSAQPSFCSWRSVAEVVPLLKILASYASTSLLFASVSQVRLQEFVRRVVA
jgi:hypothetical protein